MPDYQFCKKCDVQRYVDGWILEAAYIDAGWRKELEQHITSKGIVFERIKWVCPDCVEFERINQEAWEKERETLMEIGSVKQVSRRGVLVDERST